MITKKIELPEGAEIVAGRVFVVTRYEYAEGFGLQWCESVKQYHIGLDGNLIVDTGPHIAETYRTLKKWEAIKKPTLDDVDRQIASAKARYTETYGRAI